MNYKSIDLKDCITVDKIFTIHYFEYMSDFSFPGESHDFWEFICVDKGDVKIRMGDSDIILKKGQVAFHKPNEFHTVDATGTSAPNLVVISFRCTNPAMSFFKEKVLKIDELERTILADIIAEAKTVFKGRLDDPYQTEMIRSASATPDAEQLIKIHLEYFLIHLMRRYNQTSAVHSDSTVPALKVTKMKSDTEVLNRIIHYMETHLNSRITIEQICKDNMIGRSQLQKLFQQKTGLGIIEYFSNMKIESAKEMIRTGHMNFTQISEQLGYASIHYFSRQFKKNTDMTPSEYASSIKAMAEGAFEEKI